MIILLSPAKSLDMDATLANDKLTHPQFQDEIAALISVLKTKSVSDIKKLMGLSDKLAKLNYCRFQDFSDIYSEDNAAPAAAAFNGDVYQGLDATSLSKQELDYAQIHLRILSGLYGLLRPLDLMQPYRLEMGTKLANPFGEDLYDYWGDRITRLINDEAKRAKASHIVNLASGEYFKAVRPALLDVPIINPVFKERKDGTTKIISFYAKKARGTMARWMIQEQVERAEDLKGFAQDGYRFESENADKGELLFVRG